MKVLCYGLPDPYSLLSVLTVLFLMPAVTAVHDLASETVRAEASVWRLRHTLLLVVAVPLFAAAVLGTLSPDLFEP